MTSVMRSRHSPQMNGVISNMKSPLADLSLGLFDSYITQEKWYDYSIYKNDAVNSGAVKRMSFPGHGVWYDGIDDYHVIQNSPSINEDVLSEMSFGCWMYGLGSYADTRFLLSKYYSESDAGYEMYFQSPASGGLRARMYDELGGHSISTGVGVLDGKYHLVAATLRVGTLTVYVDGCDVGHTSLPTENIVSSTAHFTIGRRGSGGYSYHGYLNDVFISQHCLTTPEMLSLYNFGKKYYEV